MIAISKVEKYKKLLDQFEQIVNVIPATQDLMISSEDIEVVKEYAEEIKNLRVDYNTTKTLLIRLYEKEVVDKWRHLEEHPQTNIPVLLFCWNRGDHYMCVATYDKDCDLFLSVPGPADPKLQKRVYPDAWMELPLWPALPPKKKCRKE